MIAQDFRTLHHKYVACFWPVVKFDGTKASVVQKEITRELAVN